MAIWALYPLFATFDGAAFALNDNSANFRQGLITGLTAIVAAVLIAVPRTRRLIGPGLLIGAATEGINSAIYDFLVAPGHLPVGPGFWLNAAAGLVLTVAAVLAAVALARSGTVTAGPRVPAGPIPRLIAVFGLISAVVLIAQVLREAMIPGTSAAVTGRDMFPLIWSAVMTLAVPLAAVIVRPLAFGIALLAGGLANDVANTMFYTTPHNSAFAIPVAVLLVLTVALAATGRRRDTPAAPGPPAPAT